MFKSWSTSLILRGVLAVIVGIAAVAWPGVTILALVILFAVYAFMDAGLDAVRAFSSRRAGPVLGHLLLGLIDLAAGIVALTWPGPTALVSVAFGIVLAARPGIGAVTLALLFGLYSLIYGVSLIVMGIQGRSSAGTLHSVTADAA
jgi:uncharacterized membrane protein HdeD (DUF308 family)